MKKILLFVIALSSSQSFAQVQFDKQIQLIGSGGDAKLTGIQEVGAATDAASKIYVDTSISNRNYWTLNGANIYKNNTGNVGIGIVSPGFPLHIYNPSLSAEIRLESPNTGASENSGAISLAQSGTNVWIQSKRSSGWGTRANNLEFTYYDGTYRDNLVIQPGGNVGIGTTSPETKLDVRPSFGDGISLWNDGISKWIGQIQAGEYRWVTRQTGGTLAHVFGTSNYDGSNYSELMRIQKNGNVGIGITPAYKFDVKGIGRFTNGASSVALILQQLDAISNVDLWFSNSSAIGKWLLSYRPATTNGDFWIYNNTTSTANIAIQQSNGNVGIGTTAPGYKLEVAGTTRFQNTLGWGNGVYIYDGGFRLQKVDANTAAITYPNTGTGALIFDVDGVGEKARITTAGNVGIGCSSPNYKLHVVGDIAAQGGTLRASSASISTSISACSDIRYKKNIVPITDALSNVLKMKGVNFDWKEEEFPEKYFSVDRQVGFIAQEMEKIYPQVVVTEKDGYKGIDYSKLTPILVEAIKEQQKIIDGLKTDNKKLKEDYDSRINRLEALVGVNAQK